MSADNRMAPAALCCVFGPYGLDESEMVRENGNERRRVASGMASDAPETSPCSGKGSGLCASDLEILRQHFSSRRGQGQWLGFAYVEPEDVRSSDDPDAELVSVVMFTSVVEDGVLTLTRRPDGTLQLLDAEGKVFAVAGDLAALFAQLDNSGASF
jgi:hypothetical protein